MTAASTSTALVSTSLESGLSVSLHPLPLLNVSEHLTRTRLQAESKDVHSSPCFCVCPRIKAQREYCTVYGALIGTQTGRELEITNSFEFAVEGADAQVDHGFFVTRRDQCKSVVRREEDVADRSMCTQSSKSVDQLADSLRYFSRARPVGLSDV